VNGTTSGVEGSLVDPLIVLDELASKDSIISRASDNSDGSSSKPVSNISSGAVLSGAPSPLTVNQDSNLSPPSSVFGIGADTSAALISQEDEIPTIPAIESEISADIPGAEEEPPVVVPPPAKRGRKRKQKDFIDSKLNEYYNLETYFTILIGYFVTTTKMMRNEIQP